ncbi:MAG: GspH/FimT family pseudopilin [Endozoicomonas sp.]
MEVHSHTAGSDRGFTLIELMVVIAMMAILASLAYPSMMRSIANNRVKTQSEEILNIIAFARLEAISRNAVVTITPSANWTGSTIITANGVEIRRLEPLTGSTVIRSGASLTFDDRGLYTGGNISVSHSKASRQASIAITTGGAAQINKSPYP